MKKFKEFVAESVRHDSTHIHVTSHDDYVKHLEAHHPDAKSVTHANKITQHTVGTGNVVGHWDPETGKGKVKRNPSIKLSEESLDESVRVDHSAYRASHMKDAKGTGSWFVGVGERNVDVRKHKEGEHYIQHNGSLSDALKKAKALAKAKGHTVVYPQP